MFTRRLDETRKAFQKQDIAMLKAAHEAVHLEHHPSSGSYIGQYVYGALDGIITTFAVVAGVAGAKLQASVILILGFANLFADGLSMGVGNYLSLKAQEEYVSHERKRETWEVDTYPEGERREVREIFQKWGFAGKVLDGAVEAISKKKEAWIDLMMQFELGIANDNKSPVIGGITTFGAFVIAGFVPLSIFVLAVFFPGLSSVSFTVSFILTFLTLFTVGALKVLVTGRTWWQSGAEMLILGGIVAVAAYSVGYVISLYV